MKEIAERLDIAKRHVGDLQNCFKSEVYVNGEQNVTMSLGAKQTMGKSIKRILKDIDDLILCVQMSKT